MKLSHILLSAAFMAATPAIAADAVVYDEPLPVYEPVFSWVGGYVGLHAGYAWGRQDDNQGDFFEGPLPADRFDVDGFIGGVHAGYNWQSGSWVYGVEGDMDYADISGGSDFQYDQFPSGHLSMKSDWQGSLRARLGYAVDTWLFYGTGGVAFGHAKLRASDDFSSASDDQTHVGWTLGAGVEKAFTPNWVGRLEVRYTDFGDKDYDLGIFGDNIESSWNQTAVTAGISYKF